MQLNKREWQNRQLMRPSVELMQPSVWSVSYDRIFTSNPRTCSMKLRAFIFERDWMPPLQGLKCFSPFRRALPYAIDSALSGLRHAYFAGSKTPKGFHLTARGCAYPRYPGYATNKKHNPNGVASHRASPEATPLGLKPLFASLPGVARIRSTPGYTRQPPWGCGRNKKGNALSANNYSSLQQCNPVNPSNPVNPVKETARRKSYALPNFSTLELSTFRTSYSYV